MDPTAGGTECAARFSGPEQQDMGAKYGTGHQRRHGAEKMEKKWKKCLTKQAPFGIIAEHFWERRALRMRVMKILKKDEKTSWQTDEAMLEY